MKHTSDFIRLQLKTIGEFQSRALSLSYTIIVTDSFHPSLFPYLKNFSLIPTAPELFCLGQIRHRNLVFQDWDSFLNFIKEISTWTWLMGS